MTTQYVIEALFSGFWVTLQLFALCLIFATVLGVLLAVLNYCKIPPLLWVLKGFVLIIRGTPLMLQLIIVYYGFAAMGLIWQLNTAVVFCFSIHYAVYFSEVFRGAIDAVAVSQKEAATVLKLNKLQCFFYIILPQAFKKCLPGWGNEWHSLVKATTIARVIGVVELTRVAQNLVSASTMLFPLLWTGVFYLVVSFAITGLFWFAEKKLNYYKV